MERSKDIEYIDMKNALDTANQGIVDAKIVIAINMMVVEKFEEEIKKYPKPKFDKK